MCGGPNAKQNQKSKLNRTTTWENHFSPIILSEVKTALQQCVHKTLGKQA